MKKRIISILLASAVLVSAVGCGKSSSTLTEGGNGTTESANLKTSETEKDTKSLAASEGEAITIKIGTTVSENNPIGKALYQFKDTLAEATDGRINVEVYLSSQLGDETEMLTQARQNDIQMYVSNPTKTSGTIKAHAALEGFFMFDNWDHAMRFLDSEAGDAMLDAYNTMDLQGLAYFCSGFRQFTNSKRPLETIEDFKGLKIRGYSETQIAAWEAVGCNASSITWNELFSALQQKLIDGQESAIVSVCDAKLNEVQPYLTLTEHQLSIDALVVNKSFYDGLSEADQQLIADAAKECAVGQREDVAKTESETLKAMEDQGMQINELSAETKADLREAIGKVVNPVIIANAGQDNFDLVQKCIEETKEE